MTRQQVIAYQCTITPAIGCEKFKLFRRETNLGLEWRPARQTPGRPGRKYQDFSPVDLAPPRYHEALNKGREKLTFSSCWCFPVMRVPGVITWIAKARLSRLVVLGAV